MKARRPKAFDRLIMQRLRTDQWLNPNTHNIAVSKHLLNKLTVLGWIEHRGEGQALELRLTPAGLEALRAPV